MRRLLRIVGTLVVTGLAIAYLIWKIDLGRTGHELAHASLPYLLASLALMDENIATSIHFLPVHRLSYYRERFPQRSPLPVADRAGDEVLSLPLSPAHSDDDIRDVVAALRRVHSRFTG